MKNYYRCTFNDIGIYKALKKEVGFKWKELKQDPRITWLPQPTINYSSNNLSYFTEKGLKYFKEKTMKLVSEVSPKLVKELKVQKYNKNQLIGKIVYSDEFQIVTEISEKEIVIKEAHLNQLEIQLLKEYKII